MEDSEKKVRDGAKVDARLTYGRIETARRNLAKALNTIESVVLDVKSACALAEWNNDVAFEIEDAASKLGFALATLTTWDDEDGEG